VDFVKKGFTTENLCGTEPKTNRKPMIVSKNDGRRATKKETSSLLDDQRYTLLVVVGPQIPHHPPKRTVREETFSMRLPVASKLSSVLGLSALLSLLFLTDVSASYDVVQLMPENYDELTQGKTVFIKYFAPWCGHCKKMKPDWEKLAEEWHDHDVGFVAEVDCTAEGKPLCEAEGIKGFPTLKWGDPAALEDYEGARSYDALSKFADKNLKSAVCGPANLDKCADKTKRKQIEDYMKLKPSDLDKKITAEQKKLDDAESQFKKSVEKLQEEYQKLSDAKDEAVAEVKNSGLNVLKSVKAYKIKMEKEEEKKKKEGGDGTDEL